MKNIGVIFGGASVEHEISIITAIQMIENCDVSKYNVIPLYIDKVGNWYCHEDFKVIDTFKNLTEINKNYPLVSVQKSGQVAQVVLKEPKRFKSNLVASIDIMMTVVHGTNVEDGTLSGYLQTLDIPFVGPSVLSGAIGQDKAVMKDILAANKINQLAYLWFTKEDDLDSCMKQIIEEIELPVIVKPALLGSSIGISVATTAKELENSLHEAFSFCHKIVVEKLAQDFREMNISVLGDFKKQNVSVIEEVSKSADILSFEDKYMSNQKGKSSGMASLDRIIPARVDADLQEKIENIAKTTFRVLNGQAVVRIDLIVIDNEVYVNEINNVPGSLSFYLWEKCDMPYSKLIDRLIEIGINSYFERKKLIFSFDTNVLSLQSKGSKNAN